MVAVAGKVVVVTGGRRGLGAALVDEVLARGARKVYSTARAAYTDDRKEVVTHELEVRSPDSVAALAEIATDAEIVFNNAGVLLPESLLTGSFEHVTETFDVNVFGPLRVTRRWRRSWPPTAAARSSTCIRCCPGWAAPAPTAPPRRRCGRSRIRFVPSWSGRTPRS